jgi:hypothetical protein
LSRAISSRLIPLAALVGMLASGTACGPIKVNIGDVNLGISPKPTQSGSPVASPGSGSAAPASASPVATPTRTPVAASAAPSVIPSGQGSLAPNATPTPLPSAMASVAASATPSASLDPNASPTPTNDPNASPVPTGPPQPVASRGPMGPGANPSVNTFTLAGTLKPFAVGADSQGNAWVGMGQFGSSSTGSADLIKLAHDGTVIKTVKMPGAIQSVAVDRYDNVWVLHQSQSQFGSSGYSVTKVRVDGVIGSTLRVGTTMDFQSQLVIDNGLAGNIWLVESGQKIDKISASGGLLGSFTNPLSQAKVAGPDRFGNAWLAGTNSDKNVFLLASNGATTNSFHVADVSFGGQVACDTLSRPWVAGQSVMNVLNTDGSPFQTFPIGYNVRGMVPDPDGNMWLMVTTNSGGGSVTKLTNKGDSLQSFPVGDYPSSFSFGGDGSIWATGPNSNTVTRIGS